MVSETDREPVRDRSWWDAQAASALSFMQERAASPGPDGQQSALIEIGAQHPLKDGRYPDEEFTRRLEEGLRLFNELTADGLRVEIYVPGSRHTHHGVDDLVSLSDAGVMWLLQHGVDPAVVHGLDLNDRYKSADGGYGSADEARVAAEYF